MNYLIIVFLYKKKKKKPWLEIFTPSQIYEFLLRMN